MDKRSLNSKDWLLVGENAELDALREQEREADLRRLDGKLLSDHHYRQFLFQQLDIAKERGVPKHLQFWEEKIRSEELKESERRELHARMTKPQSAEESARTLFNVSHHKEAGANAISAFEKAFDLFCDKAAAEKNPDRIKEALEDAEAAILSRGRMNPSAKDEFGRELDELAKAKALDWRCRYPWRTIK